VAVGKDAFADEFFADGKAFADDRSAFADGSGPSAKGADPVVLKAQKMHQSTNNRAENQIKFVKIKRLRI
jgi:hypothetical protein